MICPKCSNDSSFVLQTRPVYTWDGSEYDAFKQRIRICKSCSFVFRSIEITLEDETSDVDVLKKINAYRRSYSFSKDEIRHRPTQNDMFSDCHTETSSG